MSEKKGIGINEFGWKLLEGAILATIVAGFSFLGTMHANNLSISTDYQKSLNSFNAARRDGEVKKSLEEMENFINKFDELKSEVNVILKNLTKSNLLLMEDFYSPSMNMGNFNISDEDLNKRINLLSKKTSELQNHYKTLTNKYHIPISEDALKVVNGVSCITTIWWAHHNDKPDDKHPLISPCNMATYDGGVIGIWCPGPNLIVPPKEPFKVYLSILREIDKQIRGLTEIRIRVKNGEFI